MDYYLSYFKSNLGVCKEGLALGTFVYIIIFITLLFSKPSRRNLKLKYVAEWLFCIYFCAILSITGMLSLSLSSFRLTGLRYSLIPLIDGYLKPMTLNFILFLPFGFLLPLALYANKGKGKSSSIHGWTWYHALIVGLEVSLAIEIIQLFFGRLAEIDDVIMNGLGSTGGYALYTCLHQLRKKASKGIIWLLIWVAVVIASYMALGYVIMGHLPI